MKITLFLAVAFSAVLSAAQTEDYQQLKELCDQQTLDYSSWCIDRKIRKQRDSARWETASAIFQSIESPTSNDYAHMAELVSAFHDAISNEKVIELMEKAIDLNPKRNRSLYANAVDKKLIEQEKPQIYGTQSYIYFGEGNIPPAFLLYEVDTSKISDAQRKEYGLRTLAEERAHVKTFYNRYLCDLLNNGKTFLEIVAFCKNEAAANPESKYITERQLFLLGIQLKRDDQLEQASIIYELMTELYPDSYNSFDLLGDCYIKLGVFDKGIEALKHSLELNPDGHFAQHTIETYKNR